MQPPAELRASIEIANALIRWKTPIYKPDMLKGFNIYRSLNSGAFDLIATVSAQSEQFLDPASTDRTAQLRYQISAISTDGEGNRSPAVLAIPMSDLNGDLCVNKTDQDLLAGSIDSCVGDPNFISQADANSDGCITLSDAVNFSSWLGWCA